MILKMRGVEKMFLRKCKFVIKAFLSTEQCVLNVHTVFVTRSIAGVKEAFRR